MGEFFSRGFSGRRRTPDELADRLPPGQYAESGFPVLTAVESAAALALEAGVDPGRIRTERFGPTG